eukprot:CAMPEP_0195511798 /NCGR_PEP_ID=MMETSP0794_2-20130614/3986_1 /TAXON_ID=515487 /ORGANISM="Stephanopyxis turris, Strain CCMP 815" /LENGTH=482 /DNA_ID=CAMNT_0040639455 /DNA_START=56 /DNA_END=1504 /DNA_ORIENTATION=-
MRKRTSADAEPGTSNGDMQIAQAPARISGIGVAGMKQRMLYLVVFMMCFVAFIFVEEAIEDAQAEKNALIEEVNGLKAKLDECGFSLDTNQKERQTNELELFSKLKALQEQLSVFEAEKRAATQEQLSVHESDTEKIYLEKGNGENDTPLNSVVSTKKADENASAMKEWRSSVKKVCKKAKSDEDAKELQKITTDSFEQTTKIDSERAFANRSSVVRCKNVVIDLGTFLGDSIRSFVDSAFVGCDKKGMKVNPLHLDEILTQADDSTPERRRLQDSFAEKMKETSLFPEDYCAYGMEGNPRFTKDLALMEYFVMGLEPRPVRHLHIYTETVVTPEDGPTKVWLDTVNKERSFWGRRIVETEEDAIKSNLTVANVDGISLSSLMRNTLLAYKPDAIEEDKSGGHLIVKMDIEGRLWKSLSELGENDVMCEFVNMGNTVVLMLEGDHFQTANDVDRKEFTNHINEVETHLKECGVSVGTLPEVN